MNRRESLKALGLTTLTGVAVLEGCKPGTKTGEEASTSANAAEAGREQWEVDREKKLLADKYFTAHEMATITLLADIIIPKDEKSGSASDAKVPEFIEFIVNDMPDNQTPLRGGLRWLDLQCLRRYNATFREATSAQQLEMVTMIAYPKKAKPEIEQGVSFFNRLRDLTATGFFTSQMGLKDIGYMGNQPNVWKGVPDDVLKAHGFNSVWG